MKRIRLSTTQRQKLYDDHNGHCHICEQPIGPGERWEISHPIPLGCGGRDDAGNRAPAHFKCHQFQTRIVDIPVISKGKRVRAFYTGAKETLQKLPLGRDDRLKKKINGTVVWRDTGRVFRTGVRR